MRDQVAFCNSCLGSLHRITPLFTNNSSFPVWIAKLTALVESQPHRPHAKLESTEKVTTSYPGEQLLTLVPQKQKRLCCHLMLKGQKCMPLSAAAEEAGAYEGGTTVMLQNKLEARSDILAHAVPMECTHPLLLKCYVNPLVLFAANTIYMFVYHWVRQVKFRTEHTTGKSRYKDYLHRKAAHCSGRQHHMKDK